jgi:hypothetical protein
MTGLPDCNRPAFAEAAASFKGHARAVLSPHAIPGGLEYAQYMDITMAMVRACDIVYCLPGWSASKGATAEIAYARCLGKYIMGAEA